MTDKELDLLRFHIKRELDKLNRLEIDGVDYLPIETILKVLPAALNKLIEAEVHRKLEQAMNFIQALKDSKENV